MFWGLRPQGWAIGSRLQLCAWLSIYQERFRFSHSVHFSATIVLWSVVAGVLWVSTSPCSGTGTSWRGTQDETDESTPVQPMDVDKSHCIIG